MRVTPGASDMLVALDVYPEQAREKARETRRVLVISPARIVTVELLDEYPGGRGAFGFRSPPEDVV